MILTKLNENFVKMRYEQWDEENYLINRGSTIAQN